MKQKEIFKKTNNIISAATRYMEIFISVVIIAVIILQIVNLIHDAAKTPLLQLDTDYFTAFLAQALNLVVGIEFVKMLCKHTPETVVEVLMFATARQMVVEHLQTWETLIGILAIALLFAIRKYLFLSPGEDDPI
ncbi:MAG: phosphate-starvation-inducible PsiE family protein [Ruminococcus sp.]|jgi:uncharacterized membrane protein (DUF373 family)